MLNCLGLLEERGFSEGFFSFKNSPGRTGVQLVEGKEGYTITRYLFCGAICCGCVKGGLVVDQQGFVVFDLPVLSFYSFS